MTHGPAVPLHPAVEQLLRWFDAEHLPEYLRPTTIACRELAVFAAETLEDGPEKTAGLRKLLEAKDCFVRQAVADRG